MGTWTLRGVQYPGLQTVNLLKVDLVLAFFWLALRDFNFLGFYMNHNKGAKSLTFRRGSEVSQAVLRKAGLF